jgi:hypothetical protein
MATRQLANCRVNRLFGAGNIRIELSSAISLAIVGCFVETFVGSFVGGFVETFIGSFVGGFVETFVGSFVGGFVGAFLG